MDSILRNKFVPLRRRKKKNIIESIKLGRRDLGINNARNNSEILFIIQLYIENIRNLVLIIAFTGRSSTEDQIKAVRIGIDLFMTKLVTLKKVERIIPLIQLVG